MQNKNFLKEAIFVVVCFLMLSCANNDPLTELELSTAPIGFVNEQSTEELTKAAPVIDKFYVFGYYTGKEFFQDYVTSGKTPKADWFLNQEVRRDVGAGYTYTPVKYWPANEDDKITFLSYTTTQLTQVELLSPDPISKLGDPVFKYTINKDDPTVDFMVSQPAYDLTRKSGDVSFFMQHVLSRTRFNIKSTVHNIKIKSIALRNVYTVAEFSADGRIWKKHAIKTDLKTYAIAEQEQLLTDQFKLLSPYYIVLPQEVVNSTLKPVYTLIFDANGVERIIEFSPDTDWQIYKSYTYNLTYTAGDLEVITQTESWKENSVNDNILANQYLNISTRELDLSNSHHFYYNTSFPTTSIAETAHYPDMTPFRLYDYYDVYFEGNKIRLHALNEKPFDAESFTMYLQGLDLHGHVSLKLPINVKVEKGSDIEINGTHWASGNIFSHDGYLDIAPNANYTGLYFRWGSLIGLAGNNAKSFQFIANKTVGFRPPEYTGNIEQWNDVPYERTMNATEYKDAFAGRYENTLGYDAKKALGDPCRYMSNQSGWTKGKWRMPTKEEYDAIVTTLKIRRINGTWGIEDESHEHITATTGALPVEAGWFVKADMTDNTIPPDNEFNTITPPKGWVFYPASGERAGYTGMLSQYSTMGYYWTASTATWDAAYRFQFSKTSTGDNPGSFFDVAAEFVSAFPIRCVRDTKK